VTTRQEKAAQTRRDLLDAARVVFERKGYLNATITDITTEAGKAAGSFYNHFDGKEALLLALADDIGDDADALVTTSPDDLRNLGPHLAVFWQLQSRHRTVMSALRDAALVDPEFAQRMHDFGIEQMKPWAELLTTLSADGAHLPASPDVSAQLLAAVATAFVGLWDGDDDAGIAALTRFVERGLLG
jgi:AcrR family transcriptional regulator